MKTLVVYYSRKGYTEDVALRTAEESDCDFLCLETIENTAGYSGFGNCVKSSLKKKGMILFPYETDVSEYEKVIICTPVWLMNMSSPIREFITKERHNIKRADYIFVHYLPLKYDGIADEMDKILRLKHENCRTVQCIWGHYVDGEAQEPASEDEYE